MAQLFKGKFDDTCFELTSHPNENLEKSVEKTDADRIVVDYQSDDTGLPIKDFTRL